MHAVYFIFFSCKIPTWCQNLNYLQDFDVAFSYCYWDFPDKKPSNTALDPGIGPGISFQQSWLRPLDH